MKQHRSFTLFPLLDQGGDVLGALKQKAVLGKFNPLILYERPRQNFPLLYAYNIKQTSDENREKYQLEVH